jgi:hypothetical protein
MIVPNNSGRKYCDECLPERNRQKANEHYKKIIQNGRVLEYRKKALERSKISHSLDPRRRMVTAAKMRAKQMGIPFDLVWSDVVVPNVCPILGIAFKPNSEYAASLDRIRPELGYVKGNVQIISMKANAMKNSASPEELLKFADWILTVVKKEPNVPEVK